MPDARSPIRYHLVLYRRDPEQGRAHFFSQMIERDLFGKIRLVRNWGFVGSKGREQVEISPMRPRQLRHWRRGPQPSGKRAIRTFDLTIHQGRRSFEISCLSKDRRSTEMDAQERVTATRCWADHSR